jgi:hypothetical protein
VPGSEWATRWGSGTALRSAKPLGSDFDLGLRSGSQTELPTRWESAWDWVCGWVWVWV